jgi:hypothetical protein
MPDHAKDRAIDGLARRQHGAFHLRQAVSAGLTRSQRRSRLANGTWVRLLDSQVFALPSHPGTWERQCVAATLSVPGGAVSGASAAALHGFTGFSKAAIEVVTRHGTTRRSPFASVRESSTVARLVVVDRIRAVSPADCIVQLAAGLDADALGSVLDDASILRPTLLAELRDLFPWLAGSRLPGSAALREVIAARRGDDVPPRSELERRLRAVLLAAGAPSPDFEATPPWIEPGLQRVDVLVRPWQLVVEGDGRAWHTRVADFERDRERDAVALSRGYATLRFTWHQLVRRSTWCRNVVVAVGADRSGSRGRLTTTSAGSTPRVPADRNDPAQWVA